MTDLSDAQQLSDRELLIRIDERTKDLHAIVKGNGTKGLVERVDSLESDRDKVKALAFVGSGSGVIGFFTALWHWLAHGPKQ